MERKRLKIVSYNIHKGFNSGNRKFILRKIKKTLDSIHPDLIFLQEVLGEHQGHQKKIQDWPIQSQFEFLADSLWDHYAYGRNAVYTSGHHGNAILSKYPFRFFENIDVSTNQFERRGILHGVIDIPENRKPCHLICIHFGLLEAERLSQIQKLCTRIESHVPHDEPLIIGGDFNDWRERATRPLHMQLEVKEAFSTVHGYHARTFPSWLPVFRLDRIYFRGLDVKDAQCFWGRPWSDLSDHSAIYAELEI